MYDPESGHYKDEASGMYYDAHSGLFFHSGAGVWCAWDPARGEFIPCTEAEPAQAVAVAWVGAYTRSHVSST